MDAEVEQILFLLNESPLRFLTIRVAEVEYGGKKYRIVGNRMKGGIEVFCDKCSFHLDWDKKRNMVLCSFKIRYIFWVGFDADLFIVFNKAYWYNYLIRR